MKVEDACRLSPNGIAETRVELRTRNNRILVVSLYARFNEVRRKYTVTQYLRREKVETFPRFQDPHRIDEWSPSERPLFRNPERHQVRLEPCLYMLIDKNRYRFIMGLTGNLYMRIYQLRLMYGDFDLESSCVVHGSEVHLQKLENHLQFLFEEYYAARLTPLDEEERNWFDLDCFWYAKNEVRRMNNFREEKIYRVREKIDLNDYILEDSALLVEQADASTDFPGGRSPG